jgi:hypothetical protein
VNSATSISPLASRLARICWGGSWPRLLVSYVGWELPCRIIMRAIIAMQATMATAMIANTGQPHPDPQKP